MAASRFSSAVLELFYGPSSEGENKRQKRRLEPVRVESGMDFKLLRNNFSECLCAWKVTVPLGYPYKADLLKFVQKPKTRFTDLIKNEITCLASVKTQLVLLAKFSIIRNNETQYMEHYFKQNDPVIDI